MLSIGTRSAHSIIEYRWAEGNLAQLPALAKELVDLKVDIILAGGSNGAQAALHATSVIPIVNAGATDLVQAGLVKSFARPGGNLTGCRGGAERRGKAFADDVRDQTGKEAGSSSPISE